MEPAKRSKPLADDGRATPATEAGIDLTDYDLHPTGWFVSKADPSWQYHSTLHVLFHATTSQFYRITNGVLSLVSVNLAEGVVTDLYSIPPAVPSWFHGQHSLLAGLTSMQGQRPTQEDRHVVQLSLAGPPQCQPCAMFAVFDGHLGTEASQYLADHLESRLCDALQACQFHPDETDLKSDIQVLNLTLKRVFQDIDQAFLHAARIRKKADGSCAAVLLVLGQLLVTAHVGDSRIVLCHRGTATALTTDHKPENEEERQRIEDKGGHVNNINGVWRVGHTSTEHLAEMRRLHGAHSSKSQAGLQLAVARSIGDIELKQPTALLSSEPDVHVRLIDREDQAVVLGCDGVFDVLSNEDVVQLLSSTTDAAWMFSPDATPKQAAGRIVRQAYQKGSTDNISVIVVGIKHDS